MVSWSSDITRLVDGDGVSVASHEGEVLVKGEFVAPSPALLAVYSVYQRREVLHQQPVDEDIAAADFAEEDALGAVVEEGDRSVRGGVAGEQRIEGEMRE